MCVCLNIFDGMQDLNSLTRNQTCASCSERAESYPLDRQRSPFSLFVCLLAGWASLVAQRVKCLPAMWETGFRSLGGEDALEEEMATHSSILGLENPMDGEAW